MYLSYWERKSFYHHRHLIICGAGFTGLSAGIYFKKSNPDKSVLVLEMDPVNGGASTKNAGFACFGSPSELLADLKKLDEDKVFGLAAERIRGLQNFRSLLGDVATGYQPVHGFEIFRFNDPLYKECKDGIAYLNDKIHEIAGERVYRKADEKIARFGFGGIEHIIENTGEGMVDTGKMYSALLKLARETGVEVMNGIKVEGFEEGINVELNTTYGTITCDKFLIATNGFAEDILPESKTVPARAQVLVTSPVKNLKVAGTFHMEEGFYYFRNIDGRILFGGGRNLDFEGETTEKSGLSEIIQHRLDEVLKNIILPGQEYKVEQRWSGIMGVGSVKQTILKPLSSKVFCAIRLSGMGLALSTLLGKEVADMIRDEKV